MNIVLCDSFVKQLKKIGSVSLNDVKILLKKYPHTTNIEVLDHFESGTIVLKCYLFQKKVRSLILLRTNNQNFIPIAIVKKETKEGKNIRKENYQNLFGKKIDSVLKEYAQDKYKIEKL